MYVFSHVPYNKICSGTCIHTGTLQHHIALTVHVQLLPNVQALTVHMFYYAYAHLLLLTVHILQLLSTSYVDYTYTTTLTVPVQHT